MFYEWCMGPGLRGGCDRGCDRAEGRARPPRLMTSVGRLLSQVYKSNFSGLCAPQAHGSDFSGLCFSFSGLCLFWFIEVLYLVYHLSGLANSPFWFIEELYLVYHLSSLANSPFWFNGFIASGLVLAYDSFNDFPPCVLCHYAREVRAVGRSRCARVALSVRY